MTPGPAVDYDVDAHVATVTLRRPESRNAQTPAMWSALRAIGAELPADVRVVVIRAEGPSFSAGLDRSLLAGLGRDGASTVSSTNQERVEGMSVRELNRMDLADMEAEIAGYQEGFRWLRSPDVISIAAVQGHAVGAGFQLALACDFRVLTDDARFAMAEASFGLVPDLGGTTALVEAVGYARALELCLTGREVDAGEAYGIGLATIVVPRDDLDAAVGDLVAAVSSPPGRTASRTKALLSSATAGTYEDQLAAERSAQVQSIREACARAEGEQAQTT